MSEENILFNNAVMEEELNRVLTAIEAGEPTPSHVWLIMHQPGIAEGEWSFDQLESFLMCLKDMANPTTLYTAWVNDPTHSPLLGAEKIIGNCKVIPGGTPINYTDLFLACGKNTRLIAGYQKLVMSILTFPWRMVVVNAPEYITKINNALVELTGHNEEGRLLPHDDVVIQKQEYTRVFSALEQGNLIPSHWHLYITYHGDTGGDIWDEKRLLTCLKEFCQTDECNDVHAVWAATPEHTIADISRQVVRDEKGRPLDSNEPDYFIHAAHINLSDFIWLCCKHERIIRSPLNFMVAIIALYPFRGLAENNKMEWVESTLARLETIHQAIKRSISH